MARDVLTEECKIGGLQLRKKVNPVGQSNIK